MVQRRIEAIKNAVLLTSDDAVIMANELLVMVLVRQLRALSQGIKDFDDVIAKLVAEHEDYHLFADLPGAGAVYAPRLLAAFGEDRQRFESARDVQCATGIAPVLERSGNSAWTHHRFRCHKFTKQTFVE
ncbi:MAG: transposase [Polyangiaceae bacterium]